MMGERDHCRLLKENWVSLVEELDPDLILNMLDSVLGNHLVCSINREPNLEVKTKRILDTLQRLPIGKFDQFCKVIAGVHPSLFESLKGRCPTKEERDFFIGAFRESLCKDILKNGHVISNRIDGKINLDTQYIALLLREAGNNGNGESNEEYPEHSSQVSLENIPLDTLAGKLVLFRGRAGVGKSILAQYMMRKYAKDRASSAFTLVFLLNLRKLVHIGREMTLSELLGMYSEYQIDKPDPSQPSAEWLEKNSQNVMIFTDGVDELPELNDLFQRMKKLTNPKMMGTPIDWCLNLMKRNVLAPSSIVLLSRPFVALRSLKYDFEIEVIGLTPEKMQVFIAKNVKEEKQNVVRKTLEKNQLLKSVCTITFYCAAICKILEMDQTIDDSMLTTYTRITAYIITRLAARKAENEPQTSVIAQELSDCLPDMAALAYRGLFENGEMTRLVFCRHDLSQIQFRNENLPKATRTGLMFFTEVKDQQGPQQALTIEAEFLHLSIQEFLGTAKLVHSDEASMARALARFSNSGRFNMSQLFLCGLMMDEKNEHVAGIKRCVSMVNHELDRTPERAVRVLSGMIEDLCNKIQETRDEGLLLHVIQMAHESQAAHLAKKVGDTIAPNGKFILSDLNITAVDMKALVFILKNSGVEHLALHNIPVDCASAYEVSTYLKNPKSLKSLMLTNNSLTVQAIRYLSQGIQSSTSLVVLKLIYNQITDEAMGMLASAVALSNTLRIWQIWDTPITDNGFQHISTGLECSKNLSSLELRNLKISDISGYHLAKGIKTSQCLQHVQLTYLEMSPEAVRHLGDALKSTSSLNFLRFEHTTITDEGMRELCKGMQQSKTLERLQLTSLPITDEGMRHLCEAVKTLTHLDLMGNDLTSRGWSLLFDTVRTGKSLTHLTLRYTKMTTEEVMAFSAAMKDTRSLKHLTLFNNEFSEDGMKLLFGGLKVSASIETLELLNVHLCKGAMSGLGEALARNRVLEQLTIVGYPMSDGAISHLCKGIRSSKSLSLLKVNEQDFSPAGMKQVRDTIRRCPCKLQSILATERVHVPTLGRFQKMNRKPVYINMEKADFTDGPHSHFMATLAKNSPLEVFHIRMEGCTMTDVCAPLLSEVFRMNQTLRHFSIQGSKLKDESFRRVLVSLTENATLQVLQLDRGTLTHRSALSLAKFIHKNRTMTHLRLGENPASGQVLSRLLDVLSENSTLQRIDFEGCLLPLGFAEHFVKFLAEMDGLSSIRAVKPRAENVCLEVTERSSTTPIYYLVSRAGGKIEFTMVAEVLQQQLSSWTDRNNILTMVDPVDSKLMVLLPDDNNEQLIEELQEELSTLGPGERLQEAYKLVPQGSVLVQPNSEQLDRASVELWDEQLGGVPQGSVFDQRETEKLRMAIQDKSPIGLDTDEPLRLIPHRVCGGKLNSEQLISKGRVTDEQNTEQFKVVQKDNEGVELNTEQLKVPPHGSLSVKAKMQSDSWWSPWRAFHKLRQKIVSKNKK